MLNTILFDLDGTLLPINMEVFEKVYVKEVGDYFSDMLPLNAFREILWTCTKSMIENTEQITNQEIFIREFNKIINHKNITNVTLNMFMDRFDKFYDTAFFKLKDSVEDVKSMKDSVKILKEKGYNLVIATNPLFPIKAINHRIRWAGFEPKDFSYISSFEKNNYCKPQLKYYKEVLDHIGKNPEECMMVGNDVQEDLVAKSIGIKTFLIKDHILHRTDDEIITDYKGDYDEFLRFVKSLPNL
ncbi:HAD family hydrolase [Clostridium sp. MSJ-4]|uniref:HAD family hydrolase n=1 Tax=Clostridium simiarum TaxID=2841506 RepID=A0ABS6F270_9CLOT|nr:HAD family hydrolase [Clostridium simiarum]MBU5591969.1 HAD family hydrolase [Clostridium simiarum]